MIIACPHCGTSYAVEADVFGPEARTVECSACGGRWQQAPAAHAEPVAPARATAAVAAPIVATAGAPDVSPEMVDPGEAFAQPPVSGRIEADRVAELPGEVSGRRRVLRGPAVGQAAVAGGPHRSGVFRVRRYGHGRTGVSGRQEYRTRPRPKPTIRMRLQPCRRNHARRQRPAHHLRAWT
ncbi:MAG: zinc-ribbon domain-containing protein [Defluviicoccus sp.]|nr:MAG: zinc-ribbon domain-containing protein [Defluviicoccus sp.]